MDSNLPLKIFLIDDDLFCLKMYELHLGVLGYKSIKLFFDGEACINTLDEQPDVVFIDHDLNGSINGSVVKKIKSINPDIYVVFLCNPENIQETISSLNLGAFDYIVKGDNDLDDMKKMLERITSIKELFSAKPVKLNWKLF